MGVRDHAIWWPGLLALPVLLGQAIHTRRRAPLLPSAPSPHSGRCEPESRPKASEISIYLVGESTVAGVGARSHDYALSGQLARRLAQAGSRTVHWSAFGLIGARAQDCLEYLIRLELAPRLEQAPADLVIVTLGVNDTTKLTPRAKWRASLQSIVSDIREASDAPILFTGVPPMEYFRALPQPLRRMLGARARMLDDDIAQVAQAAERAHHHRIALTFEPEYLAADGFHPSELGYATWAEQLAATAERLLPG